jgi:sulfur carrier protein ThiS
MNLGPGGGLVVDQAMAKVRFTRHLVRYFPTLVEGEASGVTVAEVVAALDGRYPGLAAYLLDDTGQLRKHVNVFVDGEMVNDRVQLSDPVTDESELFIVQALSGG